MLPKGWATRTARSDADGLVRTRRARRSNKDSDCQIKDLTQSSGQFSYKMACTKPQKMDGIAKGSQSSTGMTMDMTMTMAGMPGPMTQSITARRIGDCK